MADDEGRDGDAADFVLADAGTVGGDGLEEGPKAAGAAEEAAEAGEVVGRGAGEVGGGRARLEAPAGLLGGTRAMSSPASA